MRDIIVYEIIVIIYYVQACNLDNRNARDITSHTNAQKL